MGRGVVLTGMQSEETTHEARLVKAIGLLRGVAAAEVLYLVGLFAWHYRLASVFPAVAVAAGIPLLWLVVVCLCLRSRYSCIACLTAESLLGAQAGLLTYLILHHIPGDMGFGILMFLVGTTFQLGFVLVMSLLQLVVLLLRKG